MECPLRFSTTGMLVTPLLAGHPCPYPILCSLYSGPWDLFHLVSLSGSLHLLFFCLHLFIYLGTCKIPTPFFAVFARMLYHKDESILSYCLSPSHSVSPGIWAMPCLWAMSTIMPWTLCARSREEVLEGKVCIVYIFLPAGSVNTAFPNTCPSP